MIIYVM